MLSSIAIVPSAPVLIPELATGAAGELAELRAAVIAAVSGLPGRWVAVGVGGADESIGPHAVGTFAGYGADVPVSLSPHGSGPAVRLPLCALITGWIRGCVDPAVTAEVRTYAADHDPDSAVALGRELRIALDDDPDPVGVIVVADGANTLTPPAPGGYDPESEAVQAALDDALASGDAAALAGFDDRIVGRVAYQVLAGLAPAPKSASEGFRGAPYGVGYFVGTWEV